MFDMVGVVGDDDVFNSVVVVAVISLVMPLGGSFLFCVMLKKQLNPSNRHKMLTQNS